MSDATLLIADRILTPTAFQLVPDAGERSELAERLGIIGVKKLDFRGRVSPSGARDLKLEGMLGATVVQTCVVTAEPVTTRIDEPVVRLYSADYADTEGDEVEMPEDDTVEALPTEINLGRVMEEALALALPPWPRSDGVEPVNATYTEADVAPLTDEDVKPFAGLKGLRDKLAGGSSEE